MIEYRLAKQAAKDLNELEEIIPDISEKFLRLILEVCDKGYSLPQLGKPEPLKGNNSGWWSKHLTEKDRIIYKISHDEDGKKYVEVKSCKDHYK